MNEVEYARYKKEIHKTYVFLNNEIERIKKLNDPIYDPLIKELEKMANDIYLDHFCNYL